MHACMHIYVHTQYFSTYLHTYLPAYTPPYCLHICTACLYYIPVSAEPPWQYVHEGHTSMHEFCEDALALSMRIQIKIIKIKLCKCFLRWPYDSCLLWFCCWHRKILCTCRVSSPPLCWVFPLSVDFSTWDHFVQDWRFQCWDPKICRWLKPTPFLLVACHGTFCA